jgi:osmotically-inducible protein OsmY
MNAQRCQIVIILAAGLLSGCTPSDKATVNDAANHAGETVKDVGNQIEEKARPALEKAGQETKVAAEKAKKSLADSALSAKVKTAMSASDRLDTSHLDVDTVKQVVYLRGSVPKADQVHLAMNIARDTVGKGVKVVDQLKVVPATEAKK